MQVSFNRRTFCQGVATMALAVAAFGTSALTPPPAWAQDTVPTEELMKPGALPDMSLGKSDAPVSIVEYASMTCPHCAHFHETTFPELKKRYIDTGKVHFIFREFPLDPLAAAAFMLARCAGKDDSSRYFAMVDTLFRQQEEWAVQKPIPPLLAIAKQAGFTETSFQECLANQELLDNIEKVRQRAIDDFKVKSTPTFFVDGTEHAGALTIENLAKLIDAQLKEK
jgi:protein-disulfide isomerase